MVTASVYKPDAEYHISSFNIKVSKLETKQLTADHDGRLHFELKDGTEIGIFGNGLSAGFKVLDYHLQEGKKLIRVNGKNEVVINLLNGEGTLARECTLKVTISCPDTSFYIENASQQLSLQKGQYLIHTMPFKIVSDKVPPIDGSPEYLRLKVVMEVGKQSLEDFIIVPVFFDTPYFSDINIDDGYKKIIKKEENTGELQGITIDSEGTGNGNGLASAGEKILLSVDGHRLRLYTDDKYVVANEEQLKDEVIPAVWPDGYTLCSLIKIADDCPDGHVIEFIGHYETKTFMPIYRQVKWGKVKLTVNTK